MNRYVVLTVDVDPPFSSSLNYVIKDGIIRLLDLFKEYSIKATFFVPSIVAANFPKIVDKIVEHKHEIACHGFKHALSEINLSLNEKIKAIKTATKMIESITGQRPLGFRAPFFRIDRNYLIALKISNYIYDSSYVCSPLYALYGQTKFLPSKPFYLPIHGINKEYFLVEIPVSVNPFLPFPLGGGWLRILGLSWAKTGMKLNFLLQTPIVFYIHPKDIVSSEAYYLPWYYRRNTAKCINMLNELIKYACYSNAKFLKACELAEILNEKKD